MSVSAQLPRWQCVSFILAECDSALSFHTWIESLSFFLRLESKVFAFALSAGDKMFVEGWVLQMGSCLVHHQLKVIWADVFVWRQQPLAAKHCHSVSLWSKATQFNLQLFSRGRQMSSQNGSSFLFVKPHQLHISPTAATLERSTKLGCSKLWWSENDCQGIQWQSSPKSQMWKHDHPKTTIWKKWNWQWQLIGSVEREQFCNHIFVLSGLVCCIWGLMRISRLFFFDVACFMTFICFLHVQEFQRDLFIWQTFTWLSFKFEHWTDTRKQGIAIIGLLESQWECDEFSKVVECVGDRSNMLNIETTEFGVRGFERKKNGKRQTTDVCVPNEHAPSQIVFISMRKICWGRKNRWTNVFVFQNRTLSAGNDGPWKDSKAQWINTLIHFFAHAICWIFHLHVHGACVQFQLWHSKMLQVVSTHKNTTHAQTTHSTSEVHVLQNEKRCSHSTWWLQNLGDKWLIVYKKEQTHLLLSLSWTALFVNLCVLSFHDTAIPSFAWHNMVTRKHVLLKQTGFNIGQRENGHCTVHDQMPQWTWVTRLTNNNSPLSNGPQSRAKTQQTMPQKESFQFWCFTNKMDVILHKQETHEHHMTLETAPSLLIVFKKIDISLARLIVWCACFIIAMCFLPHEFAPTEFTWRQASLWGLINCGHFLKRFTNAKRLRNANLFIWLSKKQFTIVVLVKNRFTNHKRVHVCESFLTGVEQWHLMGSWNWITICGLSCKRTVKMTVHKKDHNCEPTVENWFMNNWFTNNRFTNGHLIECGDAPRCGNF